MWLFVFFDMPTDTADHRRNYMLFRKKLMKDCFKMFQYSVYMRHCPSKENADVHIKRVKAMLPELCHVGILMITDKQFSTMENLYGGQVRQLPEGESPLEMI